MSAIYTSPVGQMADLLAQCEGFDWDDGNIGKNREKHRITDWECEEIFFNRPLALGSDVAHSKSEPRYYSLGQTDRGRPLSVSFTVLNKLIRPISVREMNSRERKIDESTQEDTNIQG